MERNKTKNDYIIVSGDVCENIDKLEICLLLLLERFDKVFFTFGNHDVWIVDGATRCSLEKIEDIFRLCDRIGVIYEPTEIVADSTTTTTTTSSSSSSSVFIVPVHSWYHKEFDDEKDCVYPEGVKVPSVERVMTDYRLCKWPKIDEWRREFRDDDGNDEAILSDDYYIAKKLDALNDIDDCWNRLIAKVAEAKESGKTITVISFSHFLPRIELIPEKRFLLYPRLTSAVGSKVLNERLEQLTSLLGKSDKHTHAFGHTHFGWNLVLENNVRYVQAALAKPNEWIKRPRSLVVGDFISNLPGSNALTLYDFKPNSFSGEDDDANTYDPGLWAQYYQENKRNPDNNKTLAPWVEDYVTRIWGSRELKQQQQKEITAVLPGKSGIV